MYPPSSSSKATAPDDDDADNNGYDSSAGATHNFSSLGSQTHYNPPPPPAPRQQHNSNVVGLGDYFSGDPSSIGFEPGASSSSPLFRHRSSPAGFYDQYLPTDPNEGTGFSLGRPNGGYGGGGEGGGERGPSRVKSELRFSGGSSSHQEHNSLPRISEVEAAAAATNGVASTSMTFGNNWDNSSSHISFTIDEPGKRSRTTDFFTLETQYSMPQTSLEMARMESMMNGIPENSVPCRVRAKRGFATHPRSIAERERRTRISGKLKKLQEKLQELVPNMDKQTSYADMLDLALEHIKGLQHQVESLEKRMERCTCGACKKR